MEIKGVTYPQLSAALLATNGPAHAGQNLVFNQRDTLNQKGTRWAVTLRVRDSKGPFHRLSAQPAYSGGKQRRLVAACWHAHRNFMMALFELAPETTIRSSFTVYRGAADFADKFPATYYRNAGAPILPQAYGSLCECEEA